MNLRREFRVGPVSPMKRERRSTGMTSVPTQWAPDFFSELFTHVGQWGTHVDSPAHFVKGLRTVDQIDPKEMILPLVVIDVHGEAAANPDYTNHYQIELLTNLDQMPEAGAIAIVSFPKPKNGSGFPARVFAIVP